VNDSPVSEISMRASTSRRHQFLCRGVLSGLFSPTMISSAMRTQINTDNLASDVRAANESQHLLRRCACLICVLTCCSFHFADGGRVCADSFLLHTQSSARQVQGFAGHAAGESQEFQARVNRLRFASRLFSERKQTHHHWKASRYVTLRLRSSGSPAR
jgi:hypothetical protein